MTSILSEYESPWEFPHLISSSQTISHLVYSAGQGPSVLILHELPGLAEQTLRLGLEFARKIPARVHLPLLFGRPEPNGLNRVANMFRVCLSREIHLLAANQTSPIVCWLRALCAELRRKDQSDAPGIGVVGMCLTGGFALALVAHDSVIAPVVAQPSLPLFVHRASLGLSAKDFASVKARANALGRDAVLALRYHRDPICPGARINTIANELGPALYYIELRGCKHSTLTSPESTPSGLSQTIAFLSKRLSDVH